MEEIDKITNTSKLDSWQPSWGENANKLLQHLPLSGIEKNTLKEETINILSACGDPSNQNNASTGLVFGYIQSGKTMSFTALTALAKDNGYRVIILIAGRATNLLEQSHKRLRNDLDIDNSPMWTIKENPSDNEKQNIENILSNDSPRYKDKTLIITILKHQNYLENLFKIFSKIEISKFPVLIIDDEADQASMNTMASQQRKGVYSESLIYKKIIQLKDVITNHTFVQYTATPQAQLFISDEDKLSPSFGKFISPGEEYTGAKVFFEENKNKLIRIIPPSEIGTKEKELNSVPKSLIEAMMFYFIGTCCIFIRKISNSCSMMVHPATGQDAHKEYLDWITQLKSVWLRTLSKDDSNIGKINLITQFKDCYEQLRTKEILFQDVLNQLGGVIQETNIVELNSSDTGSKVDWGSADTHILVGGFKLDRGFTVKNLTVSYMPRKISKNADTQQQKARFYGYKRKYLDYCRVYLDKDNACAFAQYIKHEESMKEVIYELDKQGKPFEFNLILNKIFTPTRANILPEELHRGTSSGGKWTQFRAPHHSKNASKNLEYCNQFIEKFKDIFKQDEGHKQRTKEQRHLIMSIDSNKLYEDFLNKLDFVDSNELAMINRLKHIIHTHKERMVTIYLMGKGVVRKRKLKSNTSIIENVFQGKNPKQGEIIYPGDDKIFDDNITIQIHKVKIRDTEFSEVMTLAIRIPSRLQKDEDVIYKL